MLLEEHVFVKLRHGRSLTGFLVAYDEHMNLMLSDAVETVVVDGCKDVSQLQTLYVRGDLVVLIAAKS